MSFLIKVEGGCIYLTGFNRQEVPEFTYVRGDALVVKGKTTAQCLLNALHHEFCLENCSAFSCDTREHLTACPRDEWTPGPWQWARSNIVLASRHRSALSGITGPSEEQLLVRGDLADVLMGKRA